MTNSIGLEIFSIVPFLGFKGTCWEFAYDGALRNFRDKIRHEVGDLLWDDRLVMTHDRSAAITSLCAGYTARVIEAANRSLGSAFRIEFVEIRDEQEIIGKLIGCTRQRVFDFATDRVADIVGREGALLLAEKYADAPPLEWLLMSAHLANLSRLPISEMKDEVSIFDRVFSDMEGSGAFLGAVAMATRMALPPLQAAGSELTQAHSATSQSQTIWATLEETKAASGAKP